jgi:hypothetical protein
MSKLINKNNTKKVSYTKRSKVRFIILLVIAGILLSIAQTAWWISRTIYDPKEFSKITTAALTTESSRDAIAKEIVDTAFSTKPVLRATVGKTTSKIISSVLATDIASAAIEQSSEKIQLALTSSKREPVELNMQPFKKALVTISTIADKADRPVAFKTTDIPDKITIFQRDNLPELYKIYRLLLILGPLCIFSVIIIFGYLLYKMKNNTYLAVLLIGATISITSLLGLISGPLIRPPIISLIESINTRIVVGNLYDGFMHPFNNQLIITIAIGIVLMLISLVKLGYIRSTIRKISAKFS